MKTNPSSVCAVLAAVASTILAPLATPAMASLGGSADTVSADSSALRGLLHSTALVQYDVQEIDGAAVTVREYITRAGQVFAVTWQGAAPPDFQQLLGGYFPRLQPAAAAAATAHGPAVHRQLGITQSDFVMQSFGRQRDFHGIAYVPALVPDGVDTGQLP